MMKYRTYPWWMSFLLVVLINFANLNVVSAQVNDDGAAEELKALKADLGNLDLHNAYIEKAGLESPAVQKQYASWMQSFPKNASIYLALGKAYVWTDLQKSERYLKQALALEPKSIAVREFLTIKADFAGEKADAARYRKEMMELEPSNINHMLMYAVYLAKYDQTEYRNLLKVLSQMQPKNSATYYANMELARMAPSMPEKLDRYEQLREEYSMDFSRSYIVSMLEYFDFLLGTDPLRAAQMAAEMAKEKGKPQDWEPLRDKAAQVDKANQLLSLNKGAEAKALLKPLNFPADFRFNKKLLLLKAKAEDMIGNTAAAYDTLLVAIARKPSAMLKEELDVYGKKLLKNAEEINMDIWKLLERRTMPMANGFTLSQYLKPGAVSLSDFKGKVVLLTYWFPGCGPCKAEFPHFENVLKKFKKEDVVYLALNIAGVENYRIEPFMKANPYTFIPLDDAKKRVKGNLENNGLAPTNFLIDKDGRIVFSKFKTSEKTEDELEQMIRLALEKKRI